MRKKLLIITLILSLTVVFFASSAFAEYPEKPLNYIVCFNPGGESDITARTQQKFLEEVLGVDVVISYKIGGGGAVGFSELVKANPNGYTVSGYNLTNIILQPLARENPGYETKQIKPIYTFEFTPDILAVRKDSDIKTLDDFVKYAKEHPGAITVGGSGTYTPNHLGALEFDKEADIKTTYIPFTGSGEAVPSFLGGHVTALMTYTSMGVQYREEMRILAVAAEERVSYLPNVPTFKELGYNYVEGQYRGLAAPPDMPKDKVDILAEACRKVNQIPEFNNKMEEMGFELVDYGPEKSTKLIDEKIDFYKSILEDLGII